MEQALLLDPLSLPLMGTLGDAYAFAGRFDEAMAQYDKIIEMDPNFRRAFESKGMLYLVNGDHEKAVENLEKYHHLIGNPFKGLGSLGYTYGVAGLKDKALECLEKIKEREKNEPGLILHMDYAFLYSGLKEFDKAFEYLNKTYEERMGIACLGMIYCIRFPMLKDLKSDKRFTELTKRMGINA